MYNYIYYELSKAIVSEVETLLLRSHRTDVTLEQGGSRMVPLVVRGKANKPSTAGFLLTADEKQTLQSQNSSLYNTIEDRVHVISSAQELISLLEQELEVSLTGGISQQIEEKKEEVVEVPKAVSQPQSQPQRETVPIVNQAPIVEAPKPIEETHTSISETIVDDGFGLTLEEEVQVLRDENTRLKEQQKQAVSAEVVQALEKQKEGLENDLDTEKQLVEDLRGTIKDLDATIDQKSLEYSRLLLEKEQVEDQLRLGTSAPLSALSVPRNVEVYVTASSFDLAQSYQYLLCNSEDTLLIDLSPESIMDTLVKITKRNRVGKWLLGSQNIRVLYSPYERLRLAVSDGLELLTSPTNLLPPNYLVEVDWETKFHDLARLGRPVSIYLGLESNQGVQEFLHRLDKQPKVLRGTNALSERAWKRIVRQHEGAVEEVTI
jgi:hypothetical protein